jgi:hypothetical protein
MSPVSEAREWADFARDFGEFSLGRWSSLDGSTLSFWSTNFDEAAPGAGWVSGLGPGAEPATGKAGAAGGVAVAVGPAHLVRAGAAGGLAARRRRPSGAAGPGRARISRLPIAR